MGAGLDSGGVGGVRVRVDLGLGSGIQHRGGMGKVRASGWGGPWRRPSCRPQAFAGFQAGVLFGGISRVVTGYCLGRCSMEGMARLGIMLQRWEAFRWITSQGLDTVV